MVHIADNHPELRFYDSEEERKYLLAIGFTHGLSSVSGTRKIFLQLSHYL